LDLYVELPYRKSDRIFWADNNLSQETILNGFREPPFGSCLTFKKTDCPFPNLRAHYIDYRSTHALKGHDLAVYLDLYRELKDYDEMETDDMHKEYSWTKFQTVLLEFIRKNPRLQKQYTSIPVAVKKEVFSSIERRIEEYLDFATELLHHKARFEVFLGVVRFTLPALLMDLYGFGRMLRDFVGAPSPSTLLVYTGFCHTEINVSLLLKLGGSIVSQNRPVPTCDPRVDFSQEVFKDWDHCLPASALGSLLS